MILLYQDCKTKTALRLVEKSHLNCFHVLLAEQDSLIYEW